VKNIRDSKSSCFVRGSNPIEEELYNFICNLVRDVKSSNHIPTNLLFVKLMI